VTRGSVYIGVGVVFALAVSARAATAAEQQPDYQQKATAAFALGHYAEAAEAFEKAFEIAPEPGLLYNAAQAYRLAGNKERALTLYENYLRVYGGQEKGAELESRIDELKKAIEHDKAVTTKPPNGTDPTAHAEAAAAPAPLPNAPPPSEPAAPTLVSQQSTGSSEERPITSKVWFWGVVGGVVVAAIVVGVVLATGGSKDPMPSIGKVNGI
jgi:hypothetical protein